MTTDAAVRTALVRRWTFPKFNLSESVTVDAVHRALLAWCIHTPAASGYLLWHGPQWLPLADAKLRVASNGSGRCWAVGASPETEGKRVIEVMICLASDEATARLLSKPQWRVIFSATVHSDPDVSQLLVAKLSEVLSASFTGRS